jgi:predicted lipoprotein with Yx(FWY)xxD motif
VLADAHGHTIYVYVCGDDGIDQLSCDHPDDTQAYRFTIAGGGDPARAMTTFPYVIADKDAKSDSRTWSVMDIDPKTGHRAAPGQADALHVWAYRDRPIYTFAGDRKPGDIEGDAWGEFNGWRDGFKAFWLRDDYGENAS